MDLTTTHIVLLDPLYECGIKYLKLNKQPPDDIEHYSGAQGGLLGVSREQRHILYRDYSWIKFPSSLLNTSKVGFRIPGLGDPKP